MKSGGNSTIQKRKPIRQGKITMRNKMAEEKNSKKPRGKAISEVTEEKQRALDLIEMGKLSNAKSIITGLIEIEPECSLNYEILGAIERRNGNIKRAINLYRKAVSLKPEKAETHYNLGNALKQQNELEDAIREYKVAIEKEPNFAKAYNNLSIALMEKGDLQAAEESIKMAIRQYPNYPSAYNNQGNILKAKGEIEAAINAYEMAIKNKHNYADAHYNLGIAHMEQGDLARAEKSFRTTIKLKNNHTEAHINLGIACMNKGDLTSAINSYKNAIHLNRNNIDAHWNLSIVMLLSGDYTNGLQEYEWRRKKNKSRSKIHARPKCEEWNGEKIGKECKLLLVSEQGLGDTLQFMRYAIVLRNKGVNVQMCAQAKLHGLIKSSGIDPAPIGIKEASAVEEGRWLPLLSAPKHLNVSPENPIISTAYIKTRKVLVDKWRKLLKNEQRPIIGINWQGNPRIEKVILRGRSIKLELFRDVVEEEPMSLISLQKGFGSEQLEKCSFRDKFVKCQGQINQTWDFEESAAIIENCDLIITSDTSVAHLAGGMGKDTWLLLSEIPEWRWGTKGEKTFWYPSMKLFRQRSRGDWSEVMQRVKKELKKWNEAWIKQ